MGSPPRCRSSNRSFERAVATLRGTSLLALDGRALTTTLEALPGVVTGGNVTVGERARLHTGAIVKNRLRIGSDAVVGAGAVIIRDVPASTVVVGVPGRVLRHLDRPETP